MGAAEDIALAARRRNAVVRRVLAARRAQERKFWIGVACAAVVHAALFVGFGGSSMRRLGEPDAKPRRHQRGAGRCGRLPEPDHVAASTAELSR